MARPGWTVPRVRTIGQNRNQVLWLRGRDSEGSSSYRAARAPLAGGSTRNKGPFGGGSQAFRHRMRKLSAFGQRDITSTNERRIRGGFWLVACLAGLTGLLSLLAIRRVVHDLS